MHNHATTKRLGRPTSNPEISHTLRIGAGVYEAIQRLAREEHRSVRKQAEVLLLGCLAARDMMAGGGRNG